MKRIGSRKGIGIGTRHVADNGQARRNKWNGLKGLLLSMLLVVLLVSGCGNSAQTAATVPGYGGDGRAEQGAVEETRAGVAMATTAAAMEDEKAYDIAYSEDSDAAPNAVTINESVAMPTMPDLGRKIIREGYGYLETLDYDTSLNTLYKMITELGGFVESQNMQGAGLYGQNLRYADITFRVPSAKFDTAYNGLTSVGSVTNSSSSGTDITDQYVDTETRVRNLKIQEERLLALISKAPKLDEIVTLEQRLSDIRTEIETMENSLRNFDRLLEYSRITVRLQEVQYITETRPVAKSLGERLSQAFSNAWSDFVQGWEEFLVWLVESVFVLLVWAIIIAAAVLIVRSQLKKREQNRRREREEREERDALNRRSAQEAAAGVEALKKEQNPPDA